MTVENAVRREVRCWKLPRNTEDSAAINNTVLVTIYSNPWPSPSKLKWSDGTVRNDQL